MISLGLPFFTDQRQLTKNLDYANGQNHPFISKSGYVPPFHLAIPSGASFVHSKLNGTNVELNLVRTAYDGYDVITNLGKTLLAQYVQGVYTLELSYGSKTYWADDIIMCDVSDYIKIEYKHLDEFYVKPYVFPNISGFKHVFYVDSDFGKPSYSYTAQVKTRSSTILPEAHTLFKLHKFNFLATESQIDHYSQIRLYDCVEVEYRGRIYEVEDFLMTDPEWQNVGLLAGITTEVKTGSVTVSYGRGYEMICDEDDNSGGAQECDIPEIKGPYQNFNEAVADDVAAGEYFDLTQSNDHGFFPSFVFQMDPTTSYTTPQAGEAAVGKDVCFVLGNGNALGMFLSNGGSRSAGVVIMTSESTQTFNTDQAAALANLDTFYWFYDINYSHITFAKAIRNCSIELSKVLVGACVSGTHFISVVVSYANVKSLRLTTQGVSTDVVVSGTGSRSLTITNLPCDGAKHTLKVDDLLETCSAMSAYDAPLSNPGITTSGWQTVTEAAILGLTINDCESGSILANELIDIVFYGTTPLPEITNAVTGVYEIQINGVYSYVEVTKNTTSVQVKTYGGALSFVITGSSQDLITTQSC